MQSIGRKFKHILKVGYFLKVGCPAPSYIRPPTIIPILGKYCHDCIAQHFVLFFRRVVQTNIWSDGKFQINVERGKRRAGLCKYVQTQKIEVNMAYILVYR
jgi:hypothetical protein